VIQTASYQSILKGTNLNKVFDLVEGLRKSGVEIPIVFMLYYNTAYHYGLKKFVETCRKVGVDGMIIPDLPLEEQGELRQYLDADSPILIQLVSPVSGNRVPEILKAAKGFVYCVSSMGVTGQEGAFHQQVRDYLGSVRDDTDLPIMMGFGIRTPDDVLPLKDVLDGAIVGSHFIQLLNKTDYNLEEAAKYCRDFRQKWNGGSA
jgi:tryptophan synthase alpha chain